MDVIKPKDAAVWTLEPHTAMKHALLRNYLDAWFPILGSRFPEVVFIDGFAGPGVYDKGEPGSPLLALRALVDRVDFPTLGKAQFKFYFNEVDRARYQTLCTELAKYESARGGWPSNVSVKTSQDNFRELTGTALLDRRPDAPTFAFVDPFGYGDVPISVLADLTKPKSSELFVYFDFNSIQRFATASVVDPQLDELFGTSEYLQAPTAGTGDRKLFVYELYRRQLQLVCGLPYVQGFEMVNGLGKTASYLYFCTRSLLGFDKMKSVMWKHAPMGDFRFRDRLAGMQVLMSDHVDTEPLRHALLARFGEATVPVEEVEEFVVAETPFVKSHLRRKTLAPMQDANLLSSPNQARPGAFPAGTLIKFGRPIESAKVSLFEI